MLIALHTSHSLHTKENSGAEKTYSNFYTTFYFPNAPIWIKVLCNDCVIFRINNSNPNQKQITEFVSIQNGQCHHPQKETHIQW